MTTDDAELQRALADASKAIMEHVNRETDRLIGQAFRREMAAVDVSTKVETEDGTVYVTVDSREYLGLDAPLVPGWTRYVFRPRQDVQIPRTGETWRDRRTGHEYTIDGLRGDSYKLTAAHLKSPWYVSVGGFLAEFEKVK